MVCVMSAIQYKKKNENQITYNTHPLVFPEIIRDIDHRYNNKNQDCQEGRDHSDMLEC